MTNLELCRVQETWGTYHLHGKTRNFSWKIKWFAAFHLENLENMGCDLR